MTDDIKYHVTWVEKKNKPGTWSSNIVTIHMTQNGVTTDIGSYERNYGAYCDTTFFPFRRDGKDYALYSRDYTATRVMSLPDCKDLGGEEPDGMGFCPVEFYVPELEDDSGDNTPFGFLVGCVWGDDSSWKIQFIDLKDVVSGIIKRDDRLGYVELPHKVHLKDAIAFSDWHHYDELSFLYIARQDLYRLKKDFSFEKYFPSDIAGDILRYVKSHGLDDLIKDIKYQFTWHAKNRLEHVFSEEEMKLHDLVKSAAPSSQQKTILTFEEEAELLLNDIELATQNIDKMEERLKELQQAAKLKIEQDSVKS